MVGQGLAIETLQVEMTTSWIAGMRSYLCASPGDLCAKRHAVFCGTRSEILYCYRPVLVSSSNRVISSVSIVLFLTSVVIRSYPMYKSGELHGLDVFQILTVM